jgi:hypothetical protein
MESSQFQEFQRIEPRLAEYYLRKKFNKKNNIKDDEQTLERQYQITNYDIKIINDFIKTGSIASKNLESQLYCDYVEIPKEKQKFASEELMNDYRFQRLKKKYNADINANVARENISNLSRNYDNFITDYDCQKINQEKINQQNSRINMSSKYQTYDNPYILNKETPTNLREPWNDNVPSKIQYNQVVYNNQYNSYQKHEPTLDNILDKTKKYKQKVDMTNDYIKPSDYEDLNRLNLNNLNNCTVEDRNTLNINVENYIKYGNPTSKAKSLGFENPVEHFFSYIDDSIQDPDHVCFDRPQMTRTMNRKSFRSGTDY